jgi:hypothetical protein
MQKRRFSSKAAGGLLPQPGGFEGGLLAAVVRDPADLAVGQRVDQRPTTLKRHPASLPLSLLVLHDNYVVSPRVEDFVGLKTVIGPGAPVMA